MKFEFILSNTKRKKEMLNANDRPHWTQKAKITAYLRQIGRLKVSEGKYTTYTKKRPCGLVVTIYAPTKRRMDPPNFYPTVKALVDGKSNNQQPQPQQKQERPFNNSNPMDVDTLDLPF